MKKFFLPVLLLLFLPGVIFHASASPQAEMKGRPSGETETIQPNTWYYHPGDTASDPLPPDTSPAEPEIAPEAELAAPVEPSEPAEVAETAEETSAEGEIAPEAELAAPVEPAEPAEVAKTAEEAPAKPEPPARNRPFVVFNEGVTASWLTRIIKQSSRSNFVFKDFLPGLYFGIELMNLRSVWPKFPLVPQLRLAAYYPLTSTFNDMPQPSKLPLHFAVDAILGAGIKINALKYIRFSLTPGVHFFFLNSERWNYFNLGAAGILGMELPVSRGWTILINGIASFDNGNLGKNGKIEPFDIVYQYQVDFGVRYSKKARNEYPWIKSRSKTK